MWGDEGHKGDCSAKLLLQEHQQQQQQQQQQQLSPLLGGFAAEGHQGAFEKGSFLFNTPIHLQCRRSGFNP